MSPIIASGPVAAAPAEYGSNAVIVFLDGPLPRKFQAGERVTITTAPPELNAYEDGDSPLAVASARAERAIAMDRFAPVDRFREVPR